MLGAMVVHLHRELGARFDMQQLDLEARADVQRLEIAPGTQIAQMLLVLTAVGRAQALARARNLLRARLVGHQQGIRRIDDDQILDADGGDQRALGMDVEAGRILGHRIAIE